MNIHLEDFRELIKADLDREKIDEYNSALRFEIKLSRVNVTSLIHDDQENPYIVLNSVKEEPDLYIQSGNGGKDPAPKYYPSIYLDFDSIQEMQDFAIEILSKTFKYNSAHQKSKILSDLKNSK